MHVVAKITLLFITDNDSTTQSFHNGITKSCIATPSS